MWNPSRGFSKIQKRHRLAADKWEFQSLLIMLQEVIPKPPAAFRTAFTRPEVYTAM